MVHGARAARAVRASASSSGIADARLNTPVRRRAAAATAGAAVAHASRHASSFDQVVLACHSRPGAAPARRCQPAESARVLGAIRYQPNRAVLHTDASLLPRTPRAWAAWNYEGARAAAAARPRVCLHYLINRLQPLPWQRPVIVSLNPVREHRAPRRASASSTTRIRCSTPPPSRAQRALRAAAGAAPAPGSAAPGPATASTKTAWRPALAVGRSAAACTAQRRAAARARPRHERRQPQVGVRHGARIARLRPVAHAFAYPTYFLLLPMRAPARTRADGALRAQPLRRCSAFHDRDHGDGRADALAWLDELLRARRHRDANGEVWLHTYPRVLGYAFKPVSFWYCHRARRPLARHRRRGQQHLRRAPLLSARRPAPAWGRELQARKVFHVSPFCRVGAATASASCFGAGRDRAPWRASTTTTRAARCCSTSVSGTLQPAHRRGAARAFCAAIR